MKLLVDKTGVPAPAGWSLGDYPKGQDDYPVSGVSWHEAAAYAEFAGKALPTVYHWAYPLRWGGGGGKLTEAILPVSNFAGNGLVAVGTSQAMSEFGTYDQCGNVKEWCWNAMSDKRLALGSAWNQPTYLGFSSEAYEPFRRDENIGFRCMKYIGQPELTTKAQDPVPEPVQTDFSKLEPCSDEVFEVIKGIYSYSKADLEPTVEFRREYSEYAMLERVAFWDADHRHKIFVYIFLPRKNRPPYQTVFYYAGGGAWSINSLSDYPLIEGENYFKNGRAFVFPVLLGMFERRGESRAPKTPQEARDQIISLRQEFLRCVDHIATRPDEFKPDKFAYHGLSNGAGFAPIFGALEPRFRAIVAMGGGASTIRNLPDVVKGTIPYYAEIDQINFLPRVKAPFLLANGIYDYTNPQETELKPFMRLLGTPEKDKYLKLYETGHIAITPQSFKDILDFLDNYLGPVNP